MHNRFYLFSNKNTGGSGGFTRGIIEALRSDEEWSHVLLMDDDVLIDPEVLIRSSNLLSLIRDGYRNHFISGTMLRMDRPWQIHENTAQWNGIRIISHGKGRDVRNYEDIRMLERPLVRDNRYAAWWYCIVPLSRDIENDLPFPFFIYGDDMEYSLRKAEGIISLNGICVWHEPFEQKYSPVMKHYFLSRNILILNSRIKKSFKLYHSLMRLHLNFLVPLAVHDYDGASLVLESVKDFLKGPDYVMNLDDEKKIKELNGKVNPLKKREEVSTTGYFPVTLNNNKHKAPAYFFRKKLAAFSFSGDMVELRERSWSRIIHLLRRFAALSILFTLKYGSISKEYSKIRLNSEFWDKKNY